MAKVNQRLWKIPGQRTKRKAWGFTAQLPCSPCLHRHPTTGAVLHPEGVRQVRQYKGEWSKEDAEAELAKALLQIEEKKATATAGITFGEAVERYLGLKARKRTVKHDTRHLAVMKAYFGADTPLAEITASRISAWKAERLAATSKQTGEPYSAASINRPLSVLRHLLRLAHEDWEALAAVPKMRAEREPQGRVRWLGQYAPDEEQRLLDACKASRASQLAAIVTVGLEIGLRRGELLGLTWDRVDLSRGVLRLEVTKS